MVVRNEDIKSVVAEIPEGHKHIRTTITLQDGAEIVFQEATIANIVRAYIGIKTHPTEKKVVLTGQALPERKEGYAEWQLVEMRDFYTAAANDKLFLGDVQEIEKDFRHSDLEYDDDKQR